MKNLLLLLLLANILYFVWGLTMEEPPEAGVAIVDEAELGPPLAVTETPEAATSVGAILGSGRSTDLAAIVGRSCISIGPFSSDSDADRALADYRRDGMRASRRTTQGQVFVGHWVQIRNIPDRATANAILEKLTTGGLADAYLLPTDENEDGLKISLGLFGDMSRAERVELQAESLDLTADITPRMRDAEVYYVDIALPPGRGAGAIIKRFGEDKVLLRQAATCPTTG